MVPGGCLTLSIRLRQDTDDSDQNSCNNRTPIRQCIPSVRASRQVHCKHIGALVKAAWFDWYIVMHADRYLLVEYLSR